MINIFDLLVVSLVLGGLVLGVKMGLLRLATPLLLLLGTLVALKFQPDLKAILEIRLGEEVANMLAYFLLIGAAIIAVVIFAKLVELVLRVLPLRWIDHLGGSLFGAGLGTTLAVLSLVLLSTHGDASSKEVIENSIASKVLEGLLPFLLEGIRSLAI